MGRRHGTVPWRRHRTHRRQLHPPDHTRSCCRLAAGAQAHQHTVCLTHGKVAGTAPGQAACSSICTKARQRNSTCQVLPATQSQSRRGHASRIQQDNAPTNATPVTCCKPNRLRAHTLPTPRLGTHTDNDYQLPQHVDRLRQQRPARAHFGALHKCPLATGGKRTS